MEGALKQILLEETSGNSYPIPNHGIWGRSPCRYRISQRKALERGETEEIRMKQ